MTIGNLYCNYVFTLTYIYVFVDAEIVGARYLVVKFNFEVTSILSLRTFHYVRFRDVHLFHIIAYR